MRIGERIGVQAVCSPPRDGPGKYHLETFKDTQVTTTEQSLSAAEMRGIQGLPSLSS